MGSCKLGFAVTERPVLAFHLDEVDDDVFAPHSDAGVKFVGKRLKERFLECRVAAFDEHHLDDNRLRRARDVEVAGIDDETSLRLLLAMPADFVLDVDGLSGGERQSVFVNIVAGSDGKVSHCESLKGEESAYATTACAQLGQQDWLVRKDADGQPVPYVDTLRIDFVEQRAGL